MTSSANSMAESLPGKILRRLRRLVVPREFRRIRDRLRDRRALEVGGPSAVFKRWNLWPLYPVLGQVDQYNYAARTLWSGSDQTGQIIGEAAAMEGIASGTYSALLASHVLEHLANPLRALDEWRRVVAADGMIVLVVPHRDGTFDHRRPVTTLEHLVNDYKTGTGEEDTTHVAEILELHDFSRDPGAQSRAHFVDRARNNVQHRALHHHVFTTESLLTLLDYARFRILYVDVERPYHICAICAADGEPSRNAAFWSPEVAWRSKDLFPSDRIARH